MSQTKIIVGGGLTGLILAYFLRQRFSQDKIIVIESEPHCGGLLRSFDYGEYGKFDYGTHILSQTFVDEIDNLLRGLLPDDEWCFLKNQHRDLCGTYFNHQKQFHTSCPDITTLPAHEYQECYDDFFANLNNNDWQTARHAEDYFVSKFGPKIASKIMMPIVESHWDKKANELTPFAPQFLSLVRVALFKDKPPADIFNSEQVRLKAIVEDQRELFIEKYCYYPVKRGMGNVLDLLVQKLTSQNIEIKCSTTIESIQQTDKALDLKLHDGQTINADRLFWTGSLIPLASLLGIKVNFSQMDQPFKTAVCHYLVNTEPQLKDLYHFNCIDPTLKTFRVSNYKNYCAQANQKGRYPLTVELNLKEADQPKEFYQQMGFDELKKMAIIDESTKALFSACEVLPYGFPRPSLANLKEIERLRNETKNILNERLSLYGILSKKELFFMKDVLVDVFESVQHE